MIEIPETRYTKTGDVHIAYQVVGDGPRDILFVYGYGSNVDVQWEFPRFAEFLESLAGVGRLILFDKRGTGLSDRVGSAGSLEGRMDDARAVMDAAGSERAAIIGMTGGVPVALMFAASYPERTSHLVVYGGMARTVQEPDYPWGLAQPVWDLVADVADQRWGEAVTFDSYAPSHAGDQQMRKWVARYERAMGSPGTFLEIIKQSNLLDLRPVLPSLQVPTLVLHRTGDGVAPIEHGRYLAEHIPGAKLVELDGVDHWPWAGDSAALVAEIEEFVTGSRRAPAADRVLATVLFTDLVDSTARAAELGDDRWKKLLDAHNAAVTAQVERLRGKYIKSTGDGALATFDGPARAIQCAQGVRDSVRDLGLQLRAGVHTGEVEMIGDDVAGIAVHLASRVCSQAGAGDVLVSRTVVDLVAGSGLEFDERGSHALKGIPGEWQLYAVKN